MLIERFFLFTFILFFANLNSEYVCMQNEEFVRTMVAALNIRNFCIRIAKEYSEKPVHKFHFADHRFDFPEPNELERTEQGLLLIFEDNAPISLITPLGELKILDGGYGKPASPRHKLHSYLKFFFRGKAIQKIPRINHDVIGYKGDIEIFAITEFNNNIIPLYKHASEESDDTYEAIDPVWEQFLKYLGTNISVLDDPYILKYFKFDATWNERSNDSEESETESALITSIQARETKHWTTSDYPCFYNPLFVEKL